MSHASTPPAPTRSSERDAARAELLGLLGRLADNGLVVACLQGDEHERAIWTSDDPDDQDLAARCCVGCPAATACTTFVQAHPREAGVYAGTTEADRRPKIGRPPAACTTCGREVTHLARHHRLVHERTAA